MATLLNVTHVEVDGNRYVIDGQISSLTEARDLAAGINRAYASYDPYVDGTTVKFTKPAGTKG